MDHRNIHKLMGVIVFKDQYLGMVSEWMENGHLHKYLQFHPDVDRCQLCIDVASGLEYMHSQSTVHGDLKAMNVLVSSDGVAMLSDFDFSVMSEASSLLFTESSNSRSGSIRWVAPEMLAEETPKRTKESDVYALGMVCIEIFTGEVPYSQCRMDFTVITTVTRVTLPTRPTDRLKDDEQGNLVWELLLRCWSRDVSERPSAGQVVETVCSSAVVHPCHLQHDHLHTSVPTAAAPASVPHRTVLVQLQSKTTT
ncbi:tyrosine kinase catalytic domain protein [Rhizoctonia solani AG-3 Rhs1AP]|uniref:Tyrosine kinase catalytic domain protein n=1 Tax=Rhizoctonia solani AG-3 Rhs1AP TaxID=1086054 RepID=A0A0A1UL46_9AGAM|nr:tyrosine kinase catalytic domain protein [Rhizoctonia solani AG-3 Rhs1AP]